MGSKQGGLLATHLVLETGQERVKISCQSPNIAFVSNSLLKHRQGLGKEILPWNVASIQISSLSLSITLSLGFFLLHILSNPPYPRISVLVQVGVSQPGEQSNSLTNIFHQSSKFLSNMKAFFLKERLCMYGDIPPYTVYHYLTIVSPSHLETTIPFVLRSTWLQI